MLRPLEVKTPGGNRASGEAEVQGKLNGANDSRHVPITDLADEINRLHILANDHADKAVDYARRAGQLLLDVKASLPHGDFLPWLKENVEVSERQAQRYMRAALGKPITLRALKSDTVSYLPETRQWLFDGLACVGFNDDEFLFVQEAATYPGFFYVAFVGSSIDFTIKPMRGDYIERVILSLLPGRLIAGRTVAELPWAHPTDADAYFVRDLIEPHLPDGYGHLKRHQQAIGQTGGA
jgi:hypothetical protein